MYTTALSGCHCFLRLPQCVSSFFRTAIIALRVARLLRAERRGAVPTHKEYDDGAPALRTGRADENAGLATLVWQRSGSHPD